MSKDVTVGFRTTTLKATITRAANTTTYAAGDVLSGASNEVLELGSAWAAAAPAAAEDESVLRRTVNAGGSIDRLLLIDSGNQALKFAGELWLFSKAPATVTDNTAIAFTDAELISDLVAVVPISTLDWVEGIATAGAAGNAVAVKDNLSLPFTVPHFSADYTGQLFGVLVTRNAYIPLSASTMSASLTISRD